jgi:hypothetical protein
MKLVFIPGFLLLIAIYGPMNIGDLEGHHPQPTIWARAYIQRGAAWCPEGIVNDTGYIPPWRHAALGTVPHALA